MFTIQEASKILGVAVRTIRFWIQTGKIKAVKNETNHKWLISEEEVERVKNGHKD